MNMSATVLEPDSVCELSPISIPIENLELELPEHPSSHPLIFSQSYRRPWAFFPCWFHPVSSQRCLRWPSSFISTSSHQPPSFSFLNTLFLCPLLVPSSPPPLASYETLSRVPDSWLRLGVRIPIAPPWASEPMTPPIFG